MSSTAGKKLLATIVALLSCAWIMPAHASAATILVDGDDTAADEVCGAEANPCNTIQAGVNAAAVDDTVSVATSAGPYVEWIVIDKAGLRLVGPGEGVAGEARGPVGDLAGEAVIEPGAGAPAAVTVTAPGVRIDGLFFRAGLVTPDAAVPGIDAVGIDVAGSESEIHNNVMHDLGPGLRVTGSDHLVSRNLFYQDQSQHLFFGIQSTADTAGVAIRQNRFEGMQLPIALQGGRQERIVVEDNILAARAQSAGGIALAGGAGAVLRGNVLKGGGGLELIGSDGVRIEGNEISGAGDAAIAVEASLDLPANRGVVIARNQLISNGDEDDEDSAAIQVDAGALAGDLMVVANRFAGHAALDVPAIRDQTGPAEPRVMAADNWWGCNGGPGSPGCEFVVADQGAIVTAPWLVLSAAAVPAATQAPGNVRLSASIQRNSAGREVAEVAPLGPLPFEFTKVSGLGLLSTPSSLGGGAAQATLESAAPGSATVRVRLDFAAADVAVDFTSVPPVEVVVARDTSAPWLRNLHARPVPGATTLRYTLSEASVVSVGLELVKPGRRSAERCVVRRPRQRGRWCARRVPLGSLPSRGTAGANEWRLPKRLGKRLLKPGNYRATMVATDAAGNVGVPKRVAFTVLPRQP